MSNFIRISKHPLTGKWEVAEHIDDYYGSHQYGVRFPDGNVFDPRLVDIEVKENLNKKERET